MKETKFEYIYELEQFLKRLRVKEEDIKKIIEICRRYRGEEIWVTITQGETIKVLSDSCSGTLVDINEDFESNTEPKECRPVQSSCWDGHHAIECIFELKPGEWVITYVYGWQGERSVDGCSVFINPPK